MELTAGAGDSVRTELAPDTVTGYLRQAVTAARREYPNAPGLLLSGPADLRAPREVHPAFYGCLDWHSAVHTHWTMARLCRLFPKAAGVAEARAVLAEHLTASNLDAEAAYLTEHSWFERPYGRAWALALAAELRSWADEPDEPDESDEPSESSVPADPGSGSAGDSEVAGWALAVEGLRDAVCAGFVDWLPRLGYPVRAGTHANTAFALVLVLDAAPVLGAVGEQLADQVGKLAADWFGTDEDYPAQFEPSGADFLSPCLTEVALMRRVLPAEGFSRWLRRFVPGLAAGRPDGLFAPVEVSDRGDPQGVHLDGLNLSRAWCWRDLAAALPPTDPRRGSAARAAEAHLEVALPFVRTGDFLAEHWLATFATLATT